jgi:pyruvate,water dikinase
MSSRHNLLVGEIIVPGGVAVGRVATDPSPNDKGYFYLTDRLTTDDCDRITRSVGVIVEAGCSQDHSSIVCRILGIPIVTVPQARQQLTDGMTVCVDGRSGRIVTAPPFPEVCGQTPDLNEAAWVRVRHLRFQIAIFDENCVRVVNDLLSAKTEQFFLRHEFVWLKRGECPFASIRDNGIEGTIAIIQNALLRVAANLRNGQTLNFRSLDVRSDEYHFIRDPQRGKESNPQIGEHGIRHLLRRPELLKAELLAVDMLRRSGYENVVFSLPFLAYPSELDEVRQVTSAVCAVEPPIGVFIETPAVVYRLRELLERRPRSLCVGTKDLAQLILACDRTNPNVQHLYNLTDPAVVKALSDIVTECASASVPVYVYTDLQNIESLLRQLPQLDMLSVTRGDYQLIVSGLNASS